MSKSDHSGYNVKEDYKGGKDHCRNVLSETTVKVQMRHDELCLKSSPKFQKLFLSFILLN